MRRYLRLLTVITTSASLFFGSSFLRTAQLQEESNPKRQLRQNQSKSRDEGQPSPDVIGYWQALKQRSEEAEAVSWNKRSGTPKSIFGKLQAPIPGASEMAARSFLQGNAPLFKFNSDTSDLQLVSERDSLIGKHVVYQQTYNGIEVFGSQVGVHFDQSGELIAVNNNYQPDIKLKSSNARLNRATAVARANQALKNTATSDNTSKLVVLSRDDSFNLAWLIVVPTGGPTWEVFIDAQDGQVLDVPRDINRYVTGSGQVFNVNAVVATHDNNLRDNNDSASAVPPSAYSLVTLLGLEGNGFLDGQFASSNKTKKRAFSLANSFIFDRSNDGFSETMGYYYIDYAERYIQSLGFSNVNNRQQVFSVNKLKLDNSFYATNSGEITYGTGGVDDAEDAEVILHEYGHSIQDNQVPGFGRSLEGGSMGEGFGDYWGASVNAQFSGGFQDLCLAEWDATSYSTTNPPCLRRLDGTKHYPEDVDGEVHDDGEIWSAALWQIRGALGATDSDRVILSAHFLLSPTASFNEGANAIVTAGKSLGFSNRQLNQLRTILSARGFTITS
jgi:Zn-dependent metalloprotease